MTRSTVCDASACPNSTCCTAYDLLSNKSTTSQIRAYMRVCSTNCWVRLCQHLVAKTSQATSTTSNRSLSQVGYPRMTHLHGSVYYTPFTRSSWLDELGVCARWTSHHDVCSTFARCLLDRVNWVLITHGLHGVQAVFTVGEFKFLWDFSQRPKS